MDLQRNSSYHGKTFVLGTLLAAALAGVCLLSLNAGSYLDKYAREHAAVAPVGSTFVSFTNSFEGTGEVLARAIDANMPYEPTPAQIDQLPEAEGIAVFSMNPDTREEPALTGAEEAAIAGALGYFSDRGSTCSCLVVDLTTGHAIGSNYDARVYGASAFKGVVAAYVCEQMIDGGAYELGGSLQKLIESSVRYSDNDAYRTLKSAYAGGLASWVSAMGVDPTHVARYRFPTYSAQESTALWAHIASYLDGESATAEWLGEQLSSTNVSQIRDAVEIGLADGSLVGEGLLDVGALGDDLLGAGTSSEGLLGAEGERNEDAAGATGATDAAGFAGAAGSIPEGQSILEHYGAVVQNKAGWISGSYNSTSDAGLVHLDGHVYAISIMTSAPDSASSRAAVTQLALELLRAIR